ncbi:MAG: DUF402 domain-containing protein, partial [Enterococcus faecalis]|nr:DUF402 domain-containing protein [Enterococcus faecalis]
MGIPKEGEFVTIQSYKHDGHLHRTWRDTMVLKTSEYSLIGVNDHTLVTESDGRRWVTREPAIVYFHKKYWFNIIAMIREKGVSYYCNLASPYVLDDEALKYIDYDLDIKVYPNGKYHLLDEDEYEQHMNQMNYPHDIDIILRRNVDILQQWIEQKKGPFAPDFIKVWKERYKKIRDY